MASLLYNRQVEKSNQQSVPKKCAQKYSFGKKIDEGFACVQLEHFSLTSRKPNNYCLVANKIIKIKKIKEKSLLPFLEGYAIKNLQPYFQQPITSEQFNIYTTSKLEEGIIPLSTLI